MAEKQATKFPHSAYHEIISIKWGHHDINFFYCQLKNNNNKTKNSNHILCKQHPAPPTLATLSFVDALPSLLENPQILPKVKEKNIFLVIQLHVFLADKAHVMEDKHGMYGLQNIMVYFRKWSFSNLIKFSTDSPIVIFLPSPFFFLFEILFRVFPFRYPAT